MNTGDSAHFSLSPNRPDGLEIRSQSSVPPARPGKEDIKPRSITKGFRCMHLCLVAFVPVLEVFRSNYQSRWAATTYRETAGRSLRLLPASPLRGSGAARERSVLRGSSRTRPSFSARVIQRHIFPVHLRRRNELPPLLASRTLASNEHRRRIPDKAAASSI